MSKGLEATKRLKWGLDITHEERINLCECIEKALKEHEQYKSIENELGIDLVTFSKLLYALDKECVYVKVKKTKQYSGYSVNEETGEIERTIIARFSRYINATRDWFFTISFDNISSVNHYLLKDYGKTWALTKEELEKC